MLTHIIQHVWWDIHWQRPGLYLGILSRIILTWSLIMTFVTFDRPCNFTGTAIHMFSGKFAAIYSGIDKYSLFCPRHALAFYLICLLSSTQCNAFRHVAWHKLWHNIYQIIWLLVWHIPGTFPERKSWHFLSWILWQKIYQLTYPSVDMYIYIYIYIYMYT